jgi:type II restriction enzyme
MKLTFDEKLAENYKSKSQRVRILTEQWVDDSIFCPNCGYFNVEKYQNNQPVADFFCPQCTEDYELKSKQGSIGAKILDGAYSTKIERLLSSNNPNLFILNYDLKSFSVVDFFVIPKHFFVPEIIEKRKPLANNARRAGWVGSYILLQKIPRIGKIFVIKQQKIESKEKVLSEWKKTLFLRQEKDISERRWLLDIMHCIEAIGKREFILDDIYKFEDELSLLHPDNKHIKEKIRQQLQILRDNGYLDFVSRSYYRLL